MPKPNEVRTRIEDVARELHPFHVLTGEEAGLSPDWLPAIHVRYGSLDNVQIVTLGGAYQATRTYELALFDVQVQTPTGDSETERAVDRALRFCEGGSLDLIAHFALRRGLELTVGAARYVYGCGPMTLDGPFIGPYKTASYSICLFRLPVAAAGN